MYISYAVHQVTSVGSTNRLFVVSYFVLSIYLCCGHETEMPPDFGSIKSVVWAGEWRELLWPLEIDKHMPRATQSDNTQLISVNLERSPSPWILRPCLIFSFPHTHTYALICTKVYMHFSVCWHIISGYAFCYYTSELVHAIRGH